LRRRHHEIHKTNRVDPGLGLVITPTGGSGVQDNDFKAIDEMSIGRAMFFANLFDGMFVEAESLDLEGACMAGALDARQLEFED